MSSDKLSRLRTGFICQFMQTETVELLTGTKDCAQLVRTPELGKAKALPAAIFVALCQRMGTLQCICD